MAIAGFLLKAGLASGEAQAVGEALVESTQGHNNVQDMAAAVASTAAKIKADQRVEGKAALAKAIADDGPNVVARVLEWLGTGERTTLDGFIADSKGRIAAAALNNIRLA